MPLLREFMGDAANAAVMALRNVLVLAHRGRGQPYGRALLSTLCQPEKVRARLEGIIPVWHFALNNLPGVSAALLPIPWHYPPCPGSRSLLHRRTACCPVRAAGTRILGSGSAGCADASPPRQPTVLGRLLQARKLRRACGR